MGFFDVLKLRKKKTTTPDPRFTISVVNGRVQIVSNTGTKSYVDEGYLKSAKVYSIVSMLARKFASFKLYVYIVKDQTQLKRYRALTGDGATPESLARAQMIKRKALQETDESSELALLLKRPNSRQGQDLFFELLYTYKLITGDAFIYMNHGDWKKTDGKIYSMHVLPSQYMGIIGDGTLNGVKEYQLKLATIQGIPPENVLQWSYPNIDYTMSGNHLFGMSPLKAAAITLNTSNEGATAMYSMLKNGGVAKLLTRRDEFQFTPEQSEELRTKIEDEVQGSHNRGKVGVTNAMVDVLDIGMSADELKIIEALNMSFDDLCNVYGVDPLMFRNDASTYNNKLLAAKNLLNNKLVPEWSGFRDELNRVLIPVFYPNSNGNVFIDYDLSDMPEMQQDLEKLAKTLAEMWWIDPNEKRIASGYDIKDDDAMNAIYLPTGYERIDILNTPDVTIDDEINDDEQAVR